MLNRVRLYVATGDGRWDVLRRRAPMVKAANPQLRTLVTTTSTAAKQKDVLNMIDLWVPIINDLSLKRRRGSEQYCEQKAVSCTGTTPIDHDQRSHYDFVKPVSEGGGSGGGQTGLVAPRLH